MADKKDDKLTEDLTSEVVKVAAEIVSLKTVTNKLVAFGQRDSDRQTATAEKEQTERIDFLKQEIAAGDGRTKAIRALKFEMVGIETSIQDQANTNAEILANSAAALGMTEEEFKIQQSLQADSDRTNANLEKLGQQLMEAGIKPEDLMGIESYAEMSADAAEKQESVSIEALRNQPSEAAATENAEEAKADQKNQQTLLSKIAGGIGFLRDSAKKKLKSAGKGIMAILKTTLIAGFALALVAFLNSEYWEKTKKVIVEDILPGLMKVFGFLKENAEAIAIGFASIVGAIAIVKFVAILQKIKLAFITMKTAMLATKASLVTTLAPLLPIIAVAAAIATVIFALKTAFEDFQKTLEETGSMGEALKVGVAKFIGFILGFIPSLVLKLVGFVAGLFGFDDFKKKVSTIDPIQFIADAFKDMFDKIQAFFGRLFTNPVAAINQLIGDTMTMITDFGGFIYRTVLKPAIDWVGNLFGVTDTSGQLEGFVGDKLNKILNFAAEIYEQYIKPIVDWVSDLFSKVASPVGAALSNAADMAKNFIKTILRSVLPKPGGSLFSIAGIASKAIPKGVYEFAGLNPETGDLIAPAVGGGDLKPTTDGRAQQINEAGVARSGGGGGTVVVDAKSANVVNSNSTSSATFTSTSLQHPNPTVSQLAMSY